MVVSHRRSVVIESFESRMLMSTVPVTSTADSGAGSLRQALADAQAGDTVSLAGVSGTITLSSRLDITQNVTITGPGAGDLTVTSNQASIAFYVHTGLAVAMSGFTIANSGTTGNLGGAIYDGDGGGTLSISNMVLDGNQAAQKGGAIYSQAGLTITDSTISNNTVSGTMGSYGGGVMIENATLTISGSLFSGNTNTATVNTVMGMPGTNQANAYGGGLAIFNGQGASSITNSTFVDNTATADATGGSGSASGGAMILAISGSMTITHTTITGNTATGIGSAYQNGGGIYVYGPQTPTINYSIIAGNTAANSFPDIDTFIAGSYNIVSVGSGSGLVNGVDHNLVGTDSSPLNVLLGTLSDNGGPTKTLALLPGSPAIDAAVGSTSTVDARGTTRDANPDIGAFEYVAAPIVIPTPPSTPTSTDPVVVASGIITVTGTANADDIHVFSPASRNDVIRVAMNGRNWNYSLNTVTGVVINAGAGDDTVVSSTVNIGSTIFGEDGNDTLTGGAGNDTLVGGGGNDILYGLAGNDVLRGNGGKDYLYGGDGNDQLNGGTGSNWLQGDAGRDIFVGEGVDTFVAKDTVADQVFAGTAAGSRAYLDSLDTLTGTATKI